MIKDHDIELRLAYWRNAIDGSLPDGFEPIPTVKESAAEIKQLLRASSMEARTAIDTALSLSLNYLNGNGVNTKEATLEAVAALGATIRSEDLEGGSIPFRHLHPTKKATPTP